MPEGFSVAYLLSANIRLLLTTGYPAFTVHPSMRRPNQKIKELLKQHASQLVPGLELPVKKAEGGHSDLVYATRCEVKTRPHWEFQLPPADYDHGFGESNTARIDGSACCCDIPIQRVLYPQSCRYQVEPPSEGCHLLTMHCPTMHLTGNASQADSQQPQYIHLKAAAVEDEEPSAEKLKICRDMNAKVVAASADPKYSNARSDVWSWGRTPDAMQVMVRESMEAGTPKYSIAHAAVAALHIVFPEEGIQVEVSHAPVRALVHSEYSGM